MLKLGLMLMLDIPNAQINIKYYTIIIIITINMVTR